MNKIIRDSDNCTHVLVEPNESHIPSNRPLADMTTLLHHQPARDSPEEVARRYMALDQVYVAVLLVGLVIRATNHHDDDV